jgi:hypothetical protein
VWRVIASQVTSYFLIGWLASTIAGYRELFGTEVAPGAESWRLMRGFDSPWVAAGPVLQVVRGALFGCVLWPLRSYWLDHRYGVWRMWSLFIGLAILGPTAAAPGSLEGVIFTRLSVWDHLIGLPETCLQTLLFSALVHYWYRAESRWWNRAMASALALVCVFGTLGVVAALYPQAFQ